MGQAAACKADLALPGLTEDGWMASSRLRLLHGVCARGSFIVCLVEKTHWDTKDRQRCNKPIQHTKLRRLRRTFLLSG